MAKTNLQPYEKASILSRKDIILNNFFGGISWGLGATVGLALFFLIIGILAKEVNFVPIIGSFASQVLNYILITNHNLQH